MCIYIYIYTYIHIYIYIYNRWAPRERCPGLTLCTFLPQRARLYIYIYICTYV